MGKWRYVNWAIGLVILGYMYRHFFVRYQAPVNIYLWVSFGWLAMAAAGYYVFVFKMRKADQAAGKSLIAAGRSKPAAKSAAGERPKVVLNRKKTDKKS